MAIVITEEMLRNADDYLSLAQKEGMAKYFAIACVEEMPAQDGGMISPLLRERFGLKQQYLMGVLAQLYLHQDFDKQKVSYIGEKKTGGVLDACMSEEAYDEWAESHVFSQINRIMRRRDSEVADKAYELMNDFKTFSMMLNESIQALIKQRNDPVNRVMQALRIALTPENTQAILSKLDEINKMAERLEAGESNG